MTLRKSWRRLDVQWRLLPCVGLVALAVAVGCTQPPQPVDENVPTASALTNSLPVEEAIGPEVPTVMLGPGARSLTFAHVSPRTFRMGLSRPRWELGGNLSRITYEDGPPKVCTLSQPFYVATHEVSRAQWRAVFGSDPVLQPAADCDEHCPVDNITWWSAVAFADALSARDGLPTCYDGLGDACSGSAERGDLACELVESTLREFDPRRCEGYRLLTDAEWEAAARAGTEAETYIGALRTIRFERHGLAYEQEVRDSSGPGRKAPRFGTQLRAECHQDEALTQVAWYCENSFVDNLQCGEVGVTQFTTGWRCLGPQAVGQLTPNSLGLHDMLGNAAEWVWDGYERPPCAHENCPPVVDPILFPDSERRVLRGGSWRDGPFMLQAGVRTHAHRNTRGGGIRIGRTAPVVTLSTEGSGATRDRTSSIALDPQQAGLVIADPATSAELAARTVRCGQEECTFPSAQPLRFRSVPAGQYRAGLSRPLYAPAREGIPERVSFAASPPRLVTVSRSFAVAASEVTVGQWRDLFGAEPLYQPRADCEDACPVDGVTWWSALAFADELSRAAGLTPCYTGLGVDCRGEPADGGLECRLDPHALKSLLWTGCQGFRLLTDAEWELAARGGTDTETYVGNQTFAKFEPRTVFASDIPSRRFGQARRDDPRWERGLTRYWNDWCHDDRNVQTVAWYCRNAHVHPRHCAPELNSQQLVSPTVCAGPQPVASLQPNAFGLYDMLGNVAEWTWDGGWYPGEDSFPVEPQVDPQVVSQSWARGVRGGSWSDGTIAAQAGMRAHMTANVGWAGIRIGRSLPPTPATAE